MKRAEWGVSPSLPALIQKPQATEERTMKSIYYVGAGAAIVGAGCLLALQVVGGLEHTAGASFYTVASTIAAMVVVAILPVFIHFASHISKTLAVVLTVGFLGFLAYSVQATIGRTGEYRETKALGKNDAGRIQAELADVKRTIAFATPDLEKECKVVGPECRRKQKTMDALINESIKLNADLRSLGSSRLGDISSTTVAWALAGHVSEETIRKASPLGLVLGLETVIWGLVWLATAAIQAAWNMAPVQVRAVQAITEREEPLTSDELEELRRILRGVKRPVNNNELAALVGVSPGECSKRVQDAVNAGILQKCRNGREVAITLH
jgi:hypothetical protein